MREEAIVFGEHDLVGVLTHPARSGPTPGVVLLNAGLVHRVGPSRLYVRLARALAARGAPVLRFDLSGTGDSERRLDTTPFERSSVMEAREAMDELERRTGTRRFLLVGLCSGALVAFCTACADERVAGIACINSPGFEHVIPEDLVGRIDRRQAARYYWRVAFSNPRSWWKALSRRVDYSSIARAVAHAALRPFRRSERRAPASNGAAGGPVEGFSELVRRGTSVLLVFSEGDWGHDYVEVVIGDAVERLSREGGLALEIVSSADHIFTLRRNQDELVRRIGRWVEESSGARA